MYTGNYIQHWGIPLQKWGIRRFRNYDGTLTEEGKLRYAAKQKRKEEKAARKKAAAEEKTRYGGRKKLSKMTNDELNSYINRLQLEKKYLELVTELHPPKKSAVKQFLSKISSKTLSKVVGQGSDLMFKALSQKIENSAGNGKKDTKSAYIRSLEEQAEAIKLQGKIRDARLEEKEKRKAEREKREAERQARREANGDWDASVKRGVDYLTKKIKREEEKKRRKKEMKEYGYWTT